MPEHDDLPSKAEMFARVISGHANYGMASATVQRSHRFPVFFFTQIENLARIGGVPVALVINEIIECGLEAVKKELPKEIAEEMHFVSPAQSNRLTKSVRLEVKARKSPSKDK